MAKALEKLVSSAKAAGKKLLTTVAIVPFALGAFATDAAETNNLSSSSYKFYTQGKNITNLNTQFPAQKGLYRKNEDPEIKQTGNYQERSQPPKRHEEIEMEVERKGDDLEIIIQNTPRRETLNPRIPLQQQIYHEDPNNTHVYLVFPEGLTLKKEMQSLAYVNEKGRTGDLLACPPEDKKLSNILMYFNAGVEGTILNNQAVSHSEVETAFDNVVDMVPGKYGKGIKYTKDAIVWGIKKDEEKRLDALNEKYGKGYLVHKIPTLVPQGIDLTYSYFGRTTKIKFDASGLDSPQKVFIEMPQITFEQNVPGAIRKASLEGLIFEMTIEPTTSEPSKKEESGKTNRETTREKKQAISINNLYGEWQNIRREESTVLINKDGTMKINDPKPSTLKLEPIMCDLLTMYSVERNGVPVGLGSIISPNLIHQGRRGHGIDIYKRKGTPEEIIESLEEIRGIWKVAKPKRPAPYRQITIGDKIITGNSNGCTGNVLKIRKIEDCYIIETDTSINDLGLMSIFPAKNGNKLIITGCGTGCYKKE